MTGTVLEWGDPLDLGGTLLAVAEACSGDGEERRIMSLVLHRIEDRRVTSIRLSRDEVARIVRWALRVEPGIAAETEEEGER